MFDDDVADAFIHKMPGPTLSPKERFNLNDVLLKSCARVSARCAKT